MSKLFQKAVPFWLAMVLIAGISSFDSYMSARAGFDLGPVELNPMAKYLINLDGGGIALLVGFKTFGTALVLLICARRPNSRHRCLHSWRADLSRIITYASKRACAIRDACYPQHKFRAT